MKKLFLSLIYILAFITQNIILSHEFTETTQQEVENIQENKAIKNNSFKRTIGFYIAAVNDLAVFADRNLNQIIKAISHNNNINIVIHLDIKRLSQKKVAQRYYVANNSLIKIGPELNMSSGDPNTLLDFCRLITTEFKADCYDLLIWNHGTGDIEPVLRKAINPSELFHFNPYNKQIELDRSIGFFDYINSLNDKQEERGSCFDDSTSTYITNKQLGQVLDVVCKENLNGGQFETIIFDACLMAMTGVIKSIKNVNNGKGAAKYVVASQEVVLGSGYDYFKLLSPFSYRQLSTEDFIKHIVTTYAQVYSPIIQDYTQSAIKIDKFHMLEENINNVANILIDGLSRQRNFSVKRTIKTAISKDGCVRFEESSYKDYLDLLLNIQKNLNKIELQNPQETENYKQKLNKEIMNAIPIIKEVVVHNAVGTNLKRATGISIYFPEYNIHSSYINTDFGSESAWYQFLVKYLSMPNIN